MHWQVCLFENLTNEQKKEHQNADCLRRRCGFILLKLRDRNRSQFTTMDIKPPSSAHWICTSFDAVRATLLSGSPPIRILMERIFLTLL
ncbi:hypothetical protein T10_6946 [Trichinella papuae]|uniref:Uncharacterized protein n=1 Tax=Trichinella papuae TaxID=268474 RepID=A0A0V1MSF9_9BILA|nr:hypothetical protein T10_6946 [Trichinella papuae]